MIASFEELVIRCPNEESRKRISEAIKCYETGSYRAAIITSYVALCFDLIQKLIVLSNDGDGAAKVLSDELEMLQSKRHKNDPTAITGLLAFERMLLENFRDKFEFFGSIEFDDLARLREDRNRCAHPTFMVSLEAFEPSPELARLHIRSVLHHALTQEPKQGRAALAELRLIILSKYFPEKIPEAVERLKSSPLGRARESLIRAVVDDLVFGIPDKSHVYFEKTAAYIALDAVVLLHRAEAMPRAASGVKKLLQSSSDDAIQAGAIITLRNLSLSALTDKAEQVVVTRWIEKAKDFPFLMSALNRALAVDWLKISASTAIKNLNADQIKTSGPKVATEILERGVEIYISATNWDKANELAEKAAIPFAGEFSEAQIEKIFDAARNGSADLVGSHGFRKFIEAIHKESKIHSKTLVALIKKYELEYYWPDPLEPEPQTVADSKPTAS